MGEKWGVEEGGGGGLKREAWEMFRRSIEGRGVLCWLLGGEAKGVPVLGGIRVARGAVGSVR